METKQFDLIVIGAGPGGYVAALSAAKEGMKVAVCERELVGGTCLGKGCIPTKTMLHTAEIYRNVLEGGPIGIVSQGIDVDMNALQDYKNQVVDTLSQGIRAQFKKAKITFFEGEAKVLGTGSVKEVAVGEERISADKLLIATGSAPVRLPIPGMELPGVWNSDQILENREKLDSLTIIGGGVIGMEFASLYAALGTKVTVIEALDRILATLDKDFGQNLKLILKKQGVEIITSAFLKEIRAEEIEGKTELICRYELKGRESRNKSEESAQPVIGEVRSEKVLVAVGRRANTAGLFAETLGEAQLPKLERGKILVDDRFETSIPGIYAIGDVIGGIQLAHAASAEGENAVAAMLGKKLPYRMDVVPSCVYTQPEIASVGLSFDEAKEKGLDAVQLKYVMGANGKTVLTRQPRSFLRIVVTRKEGRILGAQFMCARATDMIGEFASAIVNGLTCKEMAAAIRPHPTFNEAIGEALRSWTEEEE